MSLQPVSPSYALLGSVLLSAMACLLQWLLWPYMPGVLWLMFYPAVYLSSWLGGVYAGLSAIATSLVLAWTVFVPQLHARYNAALPTGVFVAMGALFCIEHERMRRLERRMQVLFTQSADAIVVADLEGRCQSANAAATRWLGYSSSELQMLSIFDLLLPEDVPRMRRTLDAVRQGSVERLEVTLNTRTAEHVPVEVSTNALSGGLWLINLHDISQRKRAEEQFLLMRAELYEAQRLGKIGNWKWSRDTNELMFSPELYRIYELDPHEPLPSVTELESLYAPQSRAARGAALSRALEQGRPYEGERELVLPSGQRRWLHVTAEGVHDPDGVVRRLRGTAQDITDRKLAELALLESRRELRDVAAHREQEREDERKAIAREIHDELGQLLAAMRMDVSLLHRQFGDQPTAQPVLGDLSKLVERMFEVARSLATSLRPSALDLGLVLALEWLVEDFSLRWETPCDFQVNGTERALDDLRSTALFRVAQESLTNVAKYAHAHRVRMQLDFLDDTVALRIADDGQGFDPQSVMRRGGFGLLGMRERVLALKGQITVDSEPGRGTTISITIPTSIAHQDSPTDASDYPRYKSV